MPSHQVDEIESPVEDMTPRRERLFRRLVDLSDRLNSDRDVNSVIRTAIEGSKELVGARHAAMSAMLGHGHPRVTIVVSPQEGSHVGSISPDGDATGLLFNPDAWTKPFRFTQAELETDPRGHLLCRLAAGRSAPMGWLAVPVIAPRGKSIGFLQVWDKDNEEFNEDDEAILVQLSRLAAIAIENATEFQKLRDEAERKNEFLAMLAHELRSPLAAIANAARLAEHSDAKDDLSWSMEVISRQRRHLSRLIDDLADVSRIVRGKVRLRRDLMELTPLLESAADTAGALMKGRRHQLILDLERGRLWAKADPTRLEQIVVNLLNNAAKYSEDGKLIRLSAMIEAGDIVIRVKDEGLGIPPERLPEMFELFTQGDNSPLRSEGGLGVGLAVVKSLVELHGGTIAATSEGTGKGSEFTVRLPAIEEPSRPQSPAVAPRTAGRGSRVLVVDDDRDTVRSLARLLQLAGHEVTTAHSGDEAIEAAKVCQPEYVLLDIGMPGMGGYQVAALLRRSECSKKAILIAVSGYGQSEDRRRSKEADLDYHFTKPLDHDALLSLLSTGETQKDMTGRYFRLTNPT